MATALKLSDGNSETLAEGLDVLAANTVDILKSGYPRYGTVSNEGGLLVVVPTWSEEGAHRLVGAAPSPLYVIGRHPDRYREKLGVSPLDLIEATTHGEGPHVVIEWGPGLGRSLDGIGRQINRTDELKERDIHLYGESHQLFFKLSFLIRSLFSPEFDQHISEENGGTETDGIQKLKQRAAIVLAEYLEMNDLSGETNAPLAQLNENLNQAPRLLRDPKTWADLNQFLTSRTEDLPTEIIQILRSFPQNCESYLNLPEEGSITARPRDHLDIRTGKLIVGGHMSDFLHTLPSESISTAFGVRSTLYIVGDPLERGIVPFGLEMARVLRPGGAWTDDWIRGAFDERYHMDEALAIRAALKTHPELKNTVRAHVIVGPSQEFPDACPNVTVSFMMEKCYEDGTWPSKILETRLNTRLSHGDQTRSVAYELQQPTQALRTRLDAFTRGLDPHVREEQQSAHDALMASLVGRRRRPS